MCVCVCVCVCGLCECVCVVCVNVCVCECSLCSRGCVFNLCSRVGVLYGCMLGSQWPEVRGHHPSHCGLATRPSVPTGYGSTLSYHIIVHVDTVVVVQLFVAVDW